MGHRHSQVFHLVEAAGQSTLWPWSYQEPNGARNASLQEVSSFIRREETGEVKHLGKKGKEGRDPMLIDRAHHEDQRGKPGHRRPRMVTPNGWVLGDWIGAYARIHHGARKNREGPPGHTSGCRLAGKRRQGQMNNPASLHSNQIPS